MTDEEMELYLEAGRIARRIIDEGAAMICPGRSLLEVVESVEARILESGAEIAFPLNVSLNADAAHDTAAAGDDRVFAGGDLVKLDMGVAIEGRIADTALTVDLGDHAALVEASSAALDRAIAAVRPGVTAGEIGAVIQTEIEGRGFLPVANLTGHGLAPYQIHTAPTIPNVGISGGAVLEEGMAIAIEPFATTGSGRVSDSPRIEIYQQTAVKPVRLPSAKRILASVRERRGMPFSRRWLDQNRLDLALSTLVKNGIFYGYPVLHDVPGSFVSQAEHTMIVTADGAIVTTA
ncbi:type II methionyl aminopeptidase [Methanofollis fontis]|uniref:Methionine aminopeptidase n=1 Tax=Methanofollis fontis TaxID=2052832 RepID=A0A483CYV4_9EURY|nr:type II methionyl aminopeptidase [Methanofollis fontis]TAJ45452.1 type II methionyl aminopeptidase [Methanofollis fontis]